MEFNGLGAMPGPFSLDYDPFIGTDSLVILERSAMLDATRADRNSGLLFAF